MEAASKEGRASLAGAAGTVAGLTLASRISGLGRDMVFAAFFGAGAAADAFNIAYTIPNVFRRLLGEGATSMAFVPVFSEWKTTHSAEECRRLYGVTFGWFSLILFLVTLAGILASPLLVKLFAPGFEEERYRLAVLLNRWVFPYLFLVGVTAVLTGMLHTHRHFALPAAVPIFLNLGTVAGVWLLESRLHPPVLSLAIGVLAGGAMGVFSLIPALRARRISFRPSLERGHPGVRRMLRLMLPALFGVAVYQINILVSRALASLLGRGAVTYIYYSDRFLELPLGVFAVSVATVALPSLSAEAAAGKLKQVRATLQQALRLTLLVCLPATVWLAACRLPLYSTLLERGQFTSADSLATARVFLFAALGIPFIAAIRNLAPVFYSLQDTRTPVLIAFFSFLINAALAVSLMGPLGPAGLTLANTLSALFQAGYLTLKLRWRLGGLGLGALGGWLARLGLACAPVALLCWPLAGLELWRGGNELAKFSALAGLGAASVAAFLLAARLLRIEEIGQLVGGLGRRLRRR
jgi:putative peptidoglycan lipid II flippase